jgi:hypothetical protein
MRTGLRVVANRQAGAYDIQVAQIPSPDPEWPDYTQADLIRLAIIEKHLLVDREDHPVIRRLEGGL